LLLNGMWRLLFASDSRHGSFLTILRT